ncbi:thioredoxin family protein [Microbacterium jiangjiandongii]|uniref:thioredoxin family protein n=1 Tax=Microbacterium jiangjiandongii TaxID=3049071 RepID=UPI00214ABF8B|nr:thioredoxin family protein [Microbacterium sp. zg.Y843]
MVNPVDALLVLTALLAVTLGVGAFARWRQGRPQRHTPNEVVDPHRLGAERLGDTATILQFSTELCSRCPGVHRTLATLAEDRDGVVHLDVDLTHRPDIAKHFNVMQTPTTLILDRDGAIQTRFGGIPSRDVVDLELTRLSAGTARD